MTSKGKRPDPCWHENCGSRRFHAGDDGYTYCDRGHQQSERGTVIAEDTGELVTVGRKARRRESDAESIATTKSQGFSGPQAYEHYLLCLQLVLRKQLRWLIEVQKLPGELETVVRDLWALRLQWLSSKVSYDSGTDTEGRSQAFSSQSEGETGTETEGSQASRRRRRKHVEASVNLLDNISLCYIALLLLRIPVSVHDLHKWCDDGSLLYYSASREVPAVMRERLPGEYQQMLDAQDLLKPQRLHATTLEIVSTFNSATGMSTPLPNHPLLLYRWLRELSLPIEVFAATQRLTRILDIEISFKLDRKAESHSVLRYPEAQLMALLVVATKLIFPLDDVERFAASSSDVSALSMDWSAWMQARSKEPISRTKQRPLTCQDTYSVSESACVGMADEKLDRYLDWYEENMTSEDVREKGRAGKDGDFRRTMFRFFPTRSAQLSADPTASEENVSAMAERIRLVQRTLRPQRLVPHSNNGNSVAPPGSSYRRCRKVEELEGAVKVFYESAAELAALSLNGMVQAVFLTERKLQRREERMR